MQLLVVSDLHYSLKQLDWVLSVADQFDVVVLAGDHLDMASRVEPDAQIVVVLEYLSRLAEKTTVVACSGNHDLNDRNELDERAALWLERAREVGVFVDGSHVVLDDVHITVCPWWDGPRSRDAFDAALACEADEVGDRLWVWVYHAPPDASPTSWTGRRHYGDADLNAWIERYHPALVVCGHVHESPFVADGGWTDRIGDTAILNAGHELGAVPPHVVIDVDGRRLSWSSLLDRDEVSFA